jgi:O-antigen/teichoic acid export membrane protein
MSAASSPSRPVAAGTQSSGNVVVAMAVMNVAVYGFTWFTAHIVGPHEYGGYMAAMNLLLIVGVVALGLQATAARRISVDPDHVGQIEREILRVSRAAALVIGLAMLVLTPLVDRVLGLGGFAMAALIAVAAVPLTMMGSQAGILQGERRWRDLAILYLCAGVPRLVVGAALVLWHPTAFAAFLGVTVAAFAPVAYGAYALRHGREPTAANPQHAAGPILREGWHSSLALFAFFALSNVDMLVARNVLSEHDSGLYAAGLIVARAVLFLPQFVIVVAFPSMSTPAERRRAVVRSLVVVGVLGGLATVATGVLSSLALLFAGGAKYADVEPRLWVFAGLGTLMSMIQLLIYSVLARQGRDASAIVWVGLVAVVALGLTTSSITGLLTVVTAVDALVLLALLLVAWRRLRLTQPAEPREVTV